MTIKQEIQAIQDHADRIRRVAESIRVMGPIGGPRYFVTEEPGPIGGTIFHVRDRFKFGDEDEIVRTFYAYRTYHSVDEYRAKAMTRAEQLNADPLEDE